MATPPSDRAAAVIAKLRRDRRGNSYLGETIGWADGLLPGPKRVAYGYVFMTTLTYPAPGSLVYPLTWNEFGEVTSFDDGPWVDRILALPAIR